MPGGMHDRGFTLVEVLTALGVLSAAALSLAQLIVVTSGAVHLARLQTSTVTLSAARMEELRSLTWSFDSTGSPVSDLSTHLASEPPRSNGTGLRLSPAAALEQNTAGFVDFLDGGGRWISAGPAAPPGAAYVRRWSIEAPADGAVDTLVIQVLTRPIVEDAALFSRRPSVGRAEARFLTLLTRVAP